MSTNHVEMAIYTLRRLQESGKDPGCFLGRVFSHREQVEALDAAGLLVTPLHERALKAAETYAHDCVAFDPRGNMPAAACLALNTMGDIGRASLASKKPKDRYKIKTWGGSWVVEGDMSWSFNTEPQARAVAAALNALEAK